MNFKTLTLAVLATATLAGCATTDADYNGPSFLDNIKNGTPLMKQNTTMDFREDTFTGSNHWYTQNNKTNVDSPYHKNITLKSYQGIQQASIFNDDEYVFNLADNERIQWSGIIGDNERVKTGTNYVLLKNGLFKDGASWNADYIINVKFKDFYSDAKTNKRPCMGRCATAEEFETGIKSYLAAEFTVIDNNDNVVAHEDRVYTNVIHIKKVSYKNNVHPEFGEIALNRQGKLLKGLYSYKTTGELLFLEEKAMADALQQFIDAKLLNK